MMITKREYLKLMRNYHEYANEILRLSADLPKDFKASHSKSFKRITLMVQFLVKEIERLKKIKDSYVHRIQKQTAAVCNLTRAEDAINKRLAKQKELALMTPDEERAFIHELRRNHVNLLKEKKAVEKKEQEYIIEQEKLEVAIRDTNLARTSYYYLSEDEIELFEEQRPRILKGLEKYGSISLAIKNDAKITMRPSTIMYYAKKHEQFGQDVEIAKQVFKDSLDAEMLDRALNGTVNPVFQKGEYVGDYAVKDNKLLVEVAKAKLPETYNPRAYAAAHPQIEKGTTINIVSFDGVDETKHGYVRNVGVVKTVDESGRVERITQEKKLTDFYSKKDGAEIIEAEYVENELEDDGAENNDK